MIVGSLQSAVFSQSINYFTNHQSLINPPSNHPPFHPSFHAATQRMQRLYFYVTSHSSIPTVPLQHLHQLQPLQQLHQLQPLPPQHPFTPSLSPPVPLFSSSPPVRFACGLNWKALYRKSFPFFLVWNCNN